MHHSRGLSLTSKMPILGEKGEDRYLKSGPITARLAEFRLAGGLSEFFRGAVALPRLAHQEQ